MVNRANQAPTKRTFVAIELPPGVLQLLSSTQDDLRTRMGKATEAVRWVRPEGIHLTLQFLDDTRVDLLGQIEQALKSASALAKPFQLRIGGIGAFPNPRRPRVIWLGLEGDQQDMSALNTLQAAIAKQLATLGFKDEERFSPHLTLGRVRDAVRADELAVIANALSQPAKHPTAAFQVNGVSLIESHLQPGGSVYTPIAHAKFE